MKKTTTLSLALASAATMIASQSAMAATYLETFEGVTAPQDADGTAASAFADDFTSNTVGRTGTIIKPASNTYFELNTDATSSTNWGSGHTFNLGAAGFSGLTTTTLSDITLTADLWGSGFTGATGPVNFEYQQRDSGNNLIFSATFFLGVTGTQTNFGGSFDNAGFIGGTNGTSSTPVLDPDFHQILTFYSNFGGSAWTDGPNKILNIDNVSLTNVVPEPSAVTLLGLGAAGILLRRRRA